MKGRSCDLQQRLDDSELIASDAFGCPSALGVRILLKCVWVTAFASSVRTAICLSVPSD